MVECFSAQRGEAWWPDACGGAGCGDACADGGEASVRRGHEGEVARRASRRAGLTAEKLKRGAGHVTGDVPTWRAALPRELAASAGAPGHTSHEVRGGDHGGRRGVS